MHATRIVSLSFMAAVFLLEGGLRAQTPLVLPDNTPIQLRLDQTISSADARIGQTVLFEAVNDVAAGGTILIPHGAAVGAVVSEVRRATAGAKGGLLTLKLKDLMLSSNLAIPIGVKAPDQRSRATTAMTGGVVPTNVPAAGPSPLSVFAPRSDATIAKGTVIVAYVQHQVVIDPTKAGKAAVNSSTAATPATFPSLLTNEIIIAMKQSGLTDDQIVARIKSSPGNYRTDPSDLAALKKEGLSQTVLQAMIDAQRGK